MGFTHIELLPVMEHPFSGSWGYQVLGFFAPTSRFGPPEDFKFFVDACHQAGLGVILDWVPGHFPEGRARPGAVRRHGALRARRSAAGRAPGLGHADLQLRPQRGPQLPAVERAVLARGVSRRRPARGRGRVDAVPRLLAPARASGFRTGSAAARTSRRSSFLQQLNTLTHGEHPGTITAAEESTAFPGVSRPVHLGGLGFTYKWNMGWMHDMLEYAHAGSGPPPLAPQPLTFSMLYTFTENFILPFSHDEVVHGKGALLDKMPGDAWQKYATLRTLYGFMYGHPGQEAAVHGRRVRPVARVEPRPQPRLAPARRSGARRRCAATCRRSTGTTAREPALHEVDFDPAGFRWIDCNDNENSVVSFVRYARDPRDFVVMVFNFTPVPRDGYRIGVPEPGYYAELLNSDSALYGGSNVGNGGGVDSEPMPAHGFDQSLRLTVPPLGVPAPQETLA